MGFTHRNPTGLIVDLSLQALIAQYLEHGRLVSTQAFGFDPDQAPDTLLGQGFQPVRMEPAAYVQIERGALLRHRGGWLPVTIESTYLRGRYCGSGFVLYPGPPLATILRWLTSRAPATRVELFPDSDADSGRVMVDHHLCFNFSCLDGRYRVTSFHPSIRFDNSAGEYVGDDLDFAAHMRDETPCDSLGEWRAMVKTRRTRVGANKREAQRAVEKIAAWLQP